MMYLQCVLMEDSINYTEHRLLRAQRASAAPSTKNLVLGTGCWVLGVDGSLLGSAKPNPK